jgi:hypothetical protein
MDLAGNLNAYEAQRGSTNGRELDRYSGRRYERQLHTRAGEVTAKVPNPAPIFLLPSEVSVELKDIAVAEHQDSPDVFVAGSPALAGNRTHPHHSGDGGPYRGRGHGISAFVCRGPGHPWRLHLMRNRRHVCLFPDRPGTASSSWSSSTWHSNIPEYSKLKVQCRLGQPAESAACPHLRGKILKDGRVSRDLRPVHGQNRKFCATLAKR